MPSCTPVGRSGQGRIARCRAVLRRNRGSQTPHMSPAVLGLILLAMLIASLFVGFPIAYTLIILATGFGYIQCGDTVFYQM